MDPDRAVTSAYRNRKRPLDIGPCSKAKRRLFPADVNRAAAKAKAHRGPLNRRRLLVVQAACLAITTAVTAYCLEASRKGCSDQELAPIVEALRSLASTAAGAPVQDEADSGSVE